MLVTAAEPFLSNVLTERLETLAVEAEISDTNVGAPLGEFRDWNCLVRIRLV